jgi:hypothetical protein
MNTTETTGSDLLRQTVRARNAAKNAGWIAREVGVANEALHNFANGNGTLPTEKLHALTKLLFNGHALYDERLDRLRKAKQEEPKPLCTAYPPIAVGTAFVPHSGIGPQPLNPEKPKPALKTKPGWA